MLQVEDTGPGIAPAERELVFQPFYRALGTDVDGSGLGLAIVREIAQQHGAEITVDDATAPRRGDTAPASAGRAVHGALPAAPAGQRAGARTPRLPSRPAGAGRRA